MAGQRTRIDLQSIFRLTELADFIVPFSLRVVCDLGVADHSAIVCDEIAAFLLVLFFVGADPLRQAFAFLLFRVFDVVKPPPAKLIDREWHHGFGVMADDIVAAFYALLVFAFWQRVFT